MLIPGKTAVLSDQKPSIKQKVFLGAPLTI